VGELAVDVRFTRNSRFALSSAVLVLAGFLAPPLARAQESLYLLMAADTEDGIIGDDCKADLKRLELFFSEPTNIPANKQVKVTFLTSTPAPGVPKFSHDAIIDHYKALQQNIEFNPKTDSILFYYSGHGYYDPEKGHFMKTPGQLLLRTELREAIRKCRPRFSAIITDCCQELRPMHRIVVRGEVSDKGPIVDALFFQPVGLVDINSCSQGQVAGGGSPKSGGFFSSALFDLMSSSIERLETLSGSHDLTKKDHILTWREFLPLVANKTTANWKIGWATEGGCSDNDNVPGKRQCSQDPQAYSLPERTPLDPPGVKHGLTIEVIQKNGMDAGIRIVSVEPGSAADKAGLHKDDVLQEIDHKRILSAIEFDCATSFVPASGSMHVKYERAGKSDEAEMTIVSVQKGPS
jgi:Caspase domain/PDZ domain